MVEKHYKYGGIHGKKLFEVEKKRKILYTCGNSTVMDFQLKVHGQSSSCYGNSRKAARL